ncbi:MAG: hypothetical protein Q9188_002876 [Gyalolechia gomerana]
MIQSVITIGYNLASGLLLVPSQVAEGSVIWPFTTGDVSINLNTRPETRKHANTIAITLFPRSYHFPYTISANVTITLSTFAGNSSKEAVEALSLHRSVTSRATPELSSVSTRPPPPPPPPRSPPYDLLLAHDKPLPPWFPHPTISSSSFSSTTTSSSSPTTSTTSTSKPSTFTVSPPPSHDLLRYDLLLLLLHDLLRYDFLLLAHHILSSTTSTSMTSTFTVSLPPTISSSSYSSSTDSTFTVSHPLPTSNSHTTSSSSSKTPTSMVSLRFDYLLLLLLRYDLLLLAYDLYLYLYNLYLHGFPIPYDNLLLLLHDLFLLPRDLLFTTTCNSTVSFPLRSSPRI